MSANKLNRQATRASGGHGGLASPHPASMVHCDHASANSPIPDYVIDAMMNTAVKMATSVGCGDHREASIVDEIQLVCRRNLAALLGAEGADRIVLTMNCSDASSIVIYGVLGAAKPGDEVIVTATDHDSVLSPLKLLKQRTGIIIHVVPCDPVTGVIDPDDVRKAITSKTRLIACCHVSNVTGAIQPVVEVCSIAREAGIPCLIDAAQAVGRVPVDVRAMGCDFVAFPGNKCLMGPVGTGALYVRPGAEKHLTNMYEGGLGGHQELVIVPGAIPERFELGSHNIIGIAGLEASSRWLLTCGVPTIREHDARLCKIFMSLAAGINHLTVYGPWDVTQRVGIFSVNIDGMPPCDLAAALEARGILTRPGLHCAPLTHKAIGTFPAGTCRISFGPFTREDQVRRVAAELFQLAEGQPADMPIDAPETLVLAPEDLAR